MDPSQGHLKWPVIPSQRTPAVGIRTLGICLSFLLLLWLASTVSFGKAIPLRTVLAPTFIYTADAGSEELLFRPQWGCLDGICIRLKCRSLIALTQGVLLWYCTCPVTGSLLMFSSPMRCVLSSELCTSASCCLVTRPPNMVATTRTFSVTPYKCFCGGAEKRQHFWGCCVYWEESIHMRFHLTLTFFLCFYWKTCFWSVLGCPEPNTS